MATLFLVDAVTTRYLGSIIRDDPDGHTYFVQGTRDDERAKDLDGQLCDLLPRAYRKLSRRERHAWEKS